MPHPSLVVLLTCVAALVSAKPSRQCSVQSATVDIPPPEYDLLGVNVPLLIDTYVCQNKKYIADIVFAVGGPLFDVNGNRAGKLAFSKLSTLLAKRGYRVSVMERPVAFVPNTPPTTSFVLPSDFDRAIAFLGSPETVIIGGHSNGGSQALLRNAGLLPGLPLTRPGFMMDENPSIKGAILSGTAIFPPLFCDNLPDGMDPEPPFEPPCSVVVIDEADNAFEVPTLMLYGDGEHLYADPDFDIDGESGGLFSYNNQSPPKAYAVLDNCDHNSMLDVDLTLASNTFSSTLSRDEQARRNFQVMVKFLQVIGVDHRGGSAHTVDDFCTRLAQGKIVDCLSEE